MSADRKKPQPLYTVKETAEILNMCEKRVRRFVKKRLLRANKLGSLVRISPDDLMDFRCIPHGLNSSDQK